MAVLQSPLDRLTARFTTWPADEFARFTRSAVGGGRPGALGIPATMPPEQPPLRPPAPVAIAPATFELRFVRLHQEGSFEDMWDMLAEDAQRSWGGRSQFVDRMRRSSSAEAGYELLDTVVEDVRLLPEWTDDARHRTYRNVARLEVRYRVRIGLEEIEASREVHLIPAAGGWRTLHFPAPE